MKQQREYLNPNQLDGILRNGCMVDAIVPQISGAAVSMQQTFLVFFTPQEPTQTVPPPRSDHKLGIELRKILNNFKGEPVYNTERIKEEIWHVLTRFFIDNDMRGINVDIVISEFAIAGILADQNTIQL